MDIIRMDGQSGIVDSRVKIFVNAEPVPPQEPSQLPATEMEKQNIQERLVELASQIEGFLRGKFWLSMPEAMALSGITDARAAHAWRQEWHKDVAARYCREIHPSVIELYEYARVRGFFDPELEERYSSPLLIDAEVLPLLLRKVVGSTGGPR
jgi:hypothetical protein